MKAKQKKNFRPVDSKVELPRLEAEILDFWKKEGIFKKSVDKRSKDDLYTFVDGPPFVTGMPHYGHLLTSIAKDLIPRYQTMKGKRVRRVWGWDCHGLPIEDKVNKLLKVKSSAQLEKEIGVEKYVQECRKYVEGVTSDWRWYVDKIGRWADMDNAYRTMDPQFMESVIWAFKQIYDKGLIYKGKRVSLFSTDTSTPVSNFEVAMDADNYREVEDLSIFAKFKISSLPKALDVKEMNGREVFLIAWTTTPWSIPADFALAVNQKFDYCLIEYDNSLYIVAKDRLNYTFQLTEQNKELAKIIKTFKGKELEGISYDPIYDFFKQEKNKNDFKVYLSDDVTIDEGTGILHVAPAFGEVDFQLGQQYGLSQEKGLDEEGKMTVGAWKGVYLRDAIPLITEDMQKKGSLLRSEMYKHRLPFYRGENPLIYMAQDAYFIDIQKLKDQMLSLNRKINWIPSHIKDGRFADTIKTSPDWCISRNRYWATIMPIWKSEDGEKEIVVGSIEEIAKYTDQLVKKEIDGEAKYFFEDKPMDLHRDVCDKIVLKKYGREYHRIPEVLDVWMDSGSVPFAEYHYPFENNNIFEKSRPADFIIEYVPQVRAWFNVLHRISTMLFSDIAFKNAISHGTIAGNDGRKMSKSFGNYPDPKMVIEKYGADAIRLYLMASPVMKGEDMNFYEEGVAENYRFLLVYWNCYKFFVDYATLYNWDEEVDEKSLTILDKWILSRLADLHENVTIFLDSYDVPASVNVLTEFLTNDFSTWYIRRSRSRVSSTADGKDRSTCLGVMYKVIVNFTKMMAPVVPFIAEEMYRNLTGEESVHLADWPESLKHYINRDLEEEMKIARQIVEKVHAKRKEAGIKVRQPLGLAKVKNVQSEISSEVDHLVKDETNVKKFEYKKGKEQLEVELDTVLTPELKAEGEARDIMRQIQEERKKLGTKLDEYVKVVLPSWPKEFEGEIKKKALIKDLQVGEELHVTKA